MAIKSIIQSIFQNRMFFLAVIILLTLLGLATQYLAYIDFYQALISLDKFILNSTITVLVGWSVFIAIQYVKFESLLKQKWIWLGLSLLFAIIPPLIGWKINGLYNLIANVVVSINSSYWVVLFYILFLASRNVRVQDFKYSFIIEIIVSISIIVLSLVYFEKQLALVLISIICIYLISIGYKKVSVIFALVTLSIFFCLIFTNNHLINRITSYYSHQGDSHQIEQCLNSFVYGGLLGIGFEHTQRSLAEGNLLPEALRHTSFAVLIEHFGILGGVFLLSLLAFLIYRGLIIFKNSKNSPEGILILLLLFVFFLYNSVHILNCLNIFPFGSNLSFLSYDRDYFIITMIFVGLIWRKYGSS